MTGRYVRCMGKTYENVSSQDLCELLNEVLRFHSHQPDENSVLIGSVVEAKWEDPHGDIFIGITFGDIRRIQRVLAEAQLAGFIPNEFRASPDAAQR